MAAITIQSLGKVHAGGTRTGGSVSLDIADGEFVLPGLAPEGTTAGIRPC